MERISSAVAAKPKDDERRAESRFCTPGRAGGDIVHREVLFAERFRGPLSFLAHFTSQSPTISLVPWRHNAMHSLQTEKEKERICKEKAKDSRKVRVAGEKLFADKGTPERRSRIGYS